MAKVLGISGSPKAKGNTAFAVTYALDLLKNNHEIRKEYSMKTHDSRQAFRIIGIWDLLITLPFCLPYINRYVIDLFQLLHSSISPERSFPAFSNLHLLFIQLFGFMCVLWGAVRIHKPELFLAAYDCIGRISVTLILVSFALGGGSLVPLVFIASEVGFGIVEILFILKQRTQIIS